MNTKWKIIASVMLTILCFCTCFTTIFISNSNKNLEESTTLQAEGVRGIVSTVQEQTSNQYQKRIQSFLRYNVNQPRQNMIKAFADQDKEELIRLTTPYFELFKKENPYFASLTWLLPDNTSFLHMHNTNKAGGDVSRFRPDIVSVNKDHRQKAGFTASSAGMQYRIVNPVTYEGKYIGVLHFGMQVYQLINTVQEKLQIPVGLVISKEKYEKIKNKKTPGIAGSSFAILTSQTDLFKEDFENIDWTLEKQQIVLNGKDYIILKAVSLDNYARESQGYIFVALDISRHISKTRSSIIFILTLSGLLILVSFLILYFGYDSLARKILDLQVVETVNKKLEDKVTERTRELQNSLDQIKTLSGMLPICASCKQIRDDQGYWQQIEAYIQDHSEVEFSHSICQNCAKKLYPEEYEEVFGDK